MKHLKSQFCTQLKQTNLENSFHISTGSLKKAFSDTVIHHLVDELKHQFHYFCVQLCSVYMVVILPFIMILFHNVFYFISFLHEFAIFWSLVKIFVMKIFRNKRFTHVFLSSIKRTFQMTLKVEMAKKEIAFTKKNEKTCNFCGIAHFVYHKCFLALACLITSFSISV